MIFLCSLLVCLELHIFSKSELCLTQCFCLLRLFWDTVDVSVSKPSDKVLEIEQLGHSLLQIQPVSPSGLVFLGETNFCTNRYSQLCQLCGVILSDILNVYHSLAPLFCLSSSVSTSENASVATVSSSLVISSF